MKTAEGRGPTLEDAVDAALIQLGESRRNVDVKVVSESDTETVVEVVVLAARSAASASGTGTVAAAASGGAAGVGVSADSAAVASTTEAGDAATEIARDMVAELLTRMGIRCQVTARRGPEAIVVDISGRDLGVLIGWRGETLRALQTITNLITSRRLPEDQRVVVDVERYRQRREHTVREIAYRAARQVKVTGDPITLDAMQPFERRAIHLALDDDPEVTTVSTGAEPDRRVVVTPSPKAG
ncbi:MAG: KH domain-containing protein [Candidatus Dormibacteraeota bacterium]|uniref:RNA-binding protein KhpB n=1 Tax=Candidatus Dormiibacter inghamiae TaxID=3127013 RepID=A0A934KFT9_9BACT|nr:KH domain-containing protein [Candidatus Dormibacteraeota bacterium]MBJ7605714.1 KH domain-containing protein [Candidatus Dormibacteraeota bacterium]